MEGRSSQTAHWNNDTKAGTAVGNEGHVQVPATYSKKIKKVHDKSDCEIGTRYHSPKWNESAAKCIKIAIFYATL